MIEIRTDAARKCISDEKADLLAFYYGYRSSYRDLLWIVDLHRIINLDQCLCAR